MTTFVLFVWIVTGYGQAMTSHEFTGRQACEAARSAILAETGLLEKARSVCVPKGDKPQ